MSSQRQLFLGYFVFHLSELCTMSYNYSFLKPRKAVHIVEKKRKNPFVPPRLRVSCDVVLCLFYPHASSPEVMHAHVCVCMRMHACACVWHSLYKFEPSPPQSSSQKVLEWMQRPTLTLIQETESPCHEKTRWWPPCSDGLTPFRDPRDCSPWAVTNHMCLGSDGPTNTK